MAICEHADLQAIELFQPLGSKSTDAKNTPFKTKASKKDTVTCFGEKWCKLHSENSCPLYSSEKPTSENTGR